jgi:GNAT superfamily N-acetyltransferase
MKQRTYEKFYKKFCKELVEMSAPLVLDTYTELKPIFGGRKKVGMIGAEILDRYYKPIVFIDCVYVEPEYRGNGYAKNAVLHFVEKYLKDGYRVELDILNNNRVAKAFWHNLFDMIELDTNHVDTQYEITKIKETK